MYVRSPLCQTVPGISLDLGFDLELIDLDLDLDSECLSLALALSIRYLLINGNWKLEQHFYNTKSCRLCSGKTHPVQALS